jgi:glutamate synthase domain-containing protein 3
MSAAAPPTVAADPGSVEELDLASLAVRDVNRALHAATAGRAFLLRHPAGRHALAAGLTVAASVVIEGHAGYYCAGMNQLATVHVRGSTGVGVAENMMSGEVWVDGDAGQAAAASAHGGLLRVAGNAAARCAISLKGADVVVAGSVGHSAGFMAQLGTIVVCGDAGEGFGDSIYETRGYVRGTVASLGADCIEKPMRDEHRRELGALLKRSRLEDADPADFRRYGSARTLYHFDVGPGAHR